MATAIATAVAAVGGWGAAASIALSVASVGMSIAMASKGKGEDSNAERKQVLRMSNAPKTHVYGELRASGLLVLPQEEKGEQTDGEWLHIVVACSGSPIDYIGELELDSVPFTEFRDLVAFEAYPQGRQTVDPYLLQHCPDWRDDMIGKGVGWFRMSIKYNQEKFPSGLPNFTVKKRGKRVFDPRTGRTEYSANAALVIRDYLVTKGWNPAYLIDDLFIQAANICDEPVSNADGSVSKRYEIHCEIDDNEKITDVLDKMLAACGGEWVRVGGKLGLKVAAYYGVAFIDLTEDDIISQSITIQPEVEMQDAFNVVRGTYIEPKANDSQIDYPEVKIKEWVNEDGEEKVLNIDYPYVKDAYQAQRLAEIALIKSRKALTIQLQCNYKAFGCVPGTLVNLSLGQLGMDKKEFVVTDWSYSLSDAVRLTLRYNDPSMYDDIVGNVPAIPPIVSLPSGQVPAPRNLQFFAESVGDIVQGKITWINSAFRIASTNVVIKDVAGFVVQSISVPYPAQEALINGKLTGSYTAEVTAIGYLGRSETVKMSFVIAEPVAPDVVAIKASNWSIHLIPSYSNMSTPYGTLFEFYVSEIDTSSAPNRQPDEVASSWNQGGLKPDTLYYYWIRAVNSYGKSGWTKKTAKTTRESGLVTTLFEKLVGLELIAPYIASDESSSPAFVLDGRPDHGNGLIKGADIISSSMRSDDYTPGKIGYLLSKDKVELNSNVTMRGTLDGASGSFNGTVQAYQIIGDITTAKVYRAPLVRATGGGGVYGEVVNYATVRVVTGRPYTRTLIIDVTLTASAWASFEDRTWWSGSKSQAVVSSPWGTITSRELVKIGGDIDEISDSVRMFVTVPPGGSGYVSIGVRAAGVAYHTGLGKMSGVTGSDFIATLITDGKDLG